VALPTQPAHTRPCSQPTQERSRLLKQIQDAEDKEAGAEGEGEEGRQAAERKREVAIKHPTARGVYAALFKQAKWVPQLPWVVSIVLRVCVCVCARACACACACACVCVRVCVCVSMSSKGREVATRSPCGAKRASSPTP